MENNSYVFVWIDENAETKQESVTVAVVMKEKILNHLESLGWTKEKLITKNKRIRNGHDNNFGSLQKYNCKFSFSTKLVEQPINVILPRNTYMQIADVVWTREVEVGDIAIN